MNLTTQSNATALYTTSITSFSPGVTQYYFETSSTGADSYLFQLSDENDFQNIIADTVVKSDTTLTMKYELTSGNMFYWRVQAYNREVGGEWSGVFTFTTSVHTSIVESEIPSVYSLSQNYPNPFNPTTQIRYGLPEPNHVKIDLYNLIGQRVASLVNEFKTEGWYTVTVNGNQLSSGVYIYRIKAGDYVEVKKMTMVK